MSLKEIIVALKHIIAILDDEIGRWKRDRFARDLEYALTEGVIANKDYFKGVEVLVIPGCAKGNNAKIAHGFMDPGAEIVAIDPKVRPDMKLFERIKITHRESTFEKTDLSQWDKKNKAVKAGNYLQLFPVLGKKAELERMKKVVGPKGKIIIIDEVFAEKRKDRIWDLILNRGYNFFRGSYIRLTLEDYRRLFEECGLEIKFEMKYNRRTHLWMLEVK